MVDAQMKRCNKCYNYFSATREFFSLDKYSPDKLKYTCRACMREYNRQYHSKNREKERLRNKQYHLDHPGKSQQYYEDHKAEILERRRIYRETHKVEIQQYRQRAKRSISAYYKSWVQANPEARKVINNRRRARVMNCHGRHTSEDIKLLYQSQNGKCWWCGKRLRSNHYHVDHRIPMSRGGSNAPENLVISCPECNRSKHDKLPHEWIGRLL